MQETKPYSISKRVVITAYERVKANKGTYGVDEQSTFYQQWEKRQRKPYERKFVAGSYS